MDPMDVAAQDAPSSYGSIQRNAGGTVTSDTIYWSSNRTTSLRFRLTTSSSTPDMTRLPYTQINSGQSLGWTVSANTSYYLWVYNPGSDWRRDTSVSSFTITLP